jgi:hypothetical protein
VTASRAGRQVIWDHAHFKTPQITEFVILWFAWTRLATLFPKT